MWQTRRKCDVVITVALVGFDFDSLTATHDTIFWIKNLAFCRRTCRRGNHEPIRDLRELMAKYFSCFGFQNNLHMRSRASERGFESGEKFIDHTAFLNSMEWEKSTDRTWLHEVGPPRNIPDFSQERVYEWSSQKDRESGMMWRQKHT